MRDLSSREGIITRADGSAEFSQGQSKVLVGIYGPATPKRIHNYSPITVSVTPNHGLPAEKEKAYALLIQKLFEGILVSRKEKGSTLPMTIQVAIQVLRDDGSLLSTAINAVSLALLDAGVATTCVASAATCLLNRQGELISDPELEQEESPLTQASIVVARNVSGNTDLSMQCTGMISEQEYAKCLVSVRRESVKVYDFIRMAQEKKLGFC